MTTFYAFDRVRETTTSTGTGTINLGGAVTGYQTFLAAVGNGNTCYYTITDTGTGAWEVGYGTVTSGSPNTLSRSTILSSSNSGSAVSFAAGTKDVFVTAPGAKLPLLDSTGRLPAVDGSLLTNLPQPAAVAWADVATATTTDLSVPTSKNLRFTASGLPSITSFGTVASGTIFFIRAAGTFNIIYNASSMILPNAGLNMGIRSGDTFILGSLGSGNWQMLDFVPGDHRTDWTPNNYFGDGSDGSLTTSGNVSLTSSSDGDMIVKQYTSLTVSVGDTMTVSNRCRGLIIYVTGNLVVNGTLTMTARGCSGDPTVSGGSDSQAVPAGGLKIFRKTSGGSAAYTSISMAGCGTAVIATEAKQLNPGSSIGTVLTISRAGAAGAAGSATTGTAGSAGSVTQTGGGGSGGSGFAITGPTGGTGTCFSGGPGGGANWNNTGATAGSNTGGAGGNAAATGTNTGAGGGQGNPVGSHQFDAGGSYTFSSPTQGTGGLLILIVGGSVTVGAAGIISADGCSSPSRTAGINTSINLGGASGGGMVNIIYVTSYTNGGAVHCTGGTGGSNGNNPGGNGGAGCVQTLQVLAA